MSKVGKLGLLTWCDYVERLPDDRPKLFAGISWGGILATAIARRHPKIASGLILICPGLFSRKAASRIQRTALRIAHASGFRKQTVEVPLQDPSLFTDSTKWQRFIQDDPLTLRQITIDFALHNLALLDFATKAPEEVECPALLMLASTDPITNNALTRKFVERMSHSDQIIIEYAGASHTLEFEDDPFQYFQDLAAWCCRVATH